MKYLIWGTGVQAEEMYKRYYDKYIKGNIEIIGFIDNNPKNSFFHDIPVYLPCEIQKLEFDYIDIWVIVAYNDIKKQLLEKLNVSENKVKKILNNCIEEFEKNYQRELNIIATGNYQRPTLELLYIFADWHKTQEWYKYAYREFENRKHCFLAYSWIKENIDKSANVLEVASGAGGMLYHLHEDGFENLTGYDVDVKAVALSTDLNRITNGKINFYIDNAKNPIVKNIYDVIVWVNGMYHLDNYSFEDFLKKHIPMLNEEKGYMVFDMVDIKYNEVPQNEYRTDYWNKEGKKEPTEYKIRMSKGEVIDIAKKYGLDLIECYDIEEVVPRKVYVITN